MSREPTNPLASWRWYREPSAPQVFQLCRQAIAGDLRLAESARAVDDILNKANPWFCDYGHDDFRALSRLAGATLHLPVGPGRRHWAADAILAKEAELCALEDTYRAEVLAEAHRALTYAPKI